jgi:acyl-CoA thioesterase-1
MESFFTVLNVLKLAILTSFISQKYRIKQRIKRLFSSALLCGVMLFFTPVHAVLDQSKQVDGSRATDAQTILVLGDSLSAAYGLTQDEGWVNLLQNMFDENNQQYRLINAAISGETTDGGLARLPRLLAQHEPDILYIELGGNDGLQGHPINKIRDNLSQMIRLAQAQKIHVLVQEMQIPTNYGRRYNQMFIDSFTAVANRYAVPTIPFFLEEIALNPELMQRDGIHPTGEAQPLIATFMYDALLKVLHQ